MKNKNWTGKTLVRSKKSLTRNILSASIFIGLMFFVNFNAHSEVHHVSSITEANSVGEPGDTIYIMAGTYETRLTPNKSGKADSYITYLPENGNVTITGVYACVNLNARSYIRIDGFRFIHASNMWVSMENSHYNIIQNCYMERTDNWSGLNMNNASYNKILNNTMIAICPCSEACIGGSAGGPDNLVTLTNGHHNLFEGNKMYDGIHDNFDIEDTDDGNTGYNIIRNNFLSNKYHGNIDVWGVEFMLVENNIVVDAGETSYKNYCSRSTRDFTAERWQHKGIHMNSQYAIVRNNISYNNGGGIEVVSASSDPKYTWKCDAVKNRIYNNTVVKNQNGVYKNSTDPGVNNILKNNIIYDNAVYAIRIVDGTETPSTNLYINNNILGGNEVYSTSDTLIDNLSVDPLFLDEMTRDLRLVANSPMIDTGAWLTFTVNEGIASKQMEVEDAYYFMDGWDIVEGDVIQLEGKTDHIRIDSVDYENNILTLEEEYTWNIGVGISIPYEQEKPDLGALEYDTIPTPRTSFVKNSSCIAAYYMAGRYEEADSSGHDATLERTNENIELTYETPHGYKGCSRRFLSDGILSHEDGLSTDLNGSSQPMSWSMWVYLDTVPTEDIFLVNKAEESTNFQYRIFYDFSQETFAWLISGDGSNYTECKGEISVEPWKWYHLAGSYDVDKEEMLLYINGAIDSSDYNPITHNQGIFNGDANFEVGGSEAGNKLNGKIDELILFDTVISPQQITGIYSNGIDASLGANDLHHAMKDDIKVSTELIFNDSDMDITLFPNPVNNNVLTIKGVDEISEKVNIAIYSIEGKLVYASNECYLPEIIDMTTYCNGMYIINIWDSNSLKFKAKIIKE